MTTDLIKIPFSFCNDLDIPKIPQDVDPESIREQLYNAGIEYLELVGVPGGDKVLFVEDDAEFLMDFYYQLDEILNTDDFLEHIAYLNGTDFIISAHRADSQLRVAITRQPHSDLRFLSSTEVEVSLSQYVNAWRRLAHALVAAAGKVSAVKPESQGETPAD